MMYVIGRKIVAVPSCSLTTSSEYNLGTSGGNRIDGVGGKRTENLPGDSNTESPDEYVSTNGLRYANNAESVAEYDA